MKVISKELQYSDTGYGVLYCIKDNDTFVFTLSNYSWSLPVDNEDDIENRMQWDNHFQGRKNKVIDEMKEMIRQFEEQQ
ncbi:MAG TPA: hypothetical protein VK105_06035 [Virgibacillus sp.]|nr:hypothetical protein [Virgibacillus sp.]HLR66686.1 hypothetical protein [Virgibacillus sp.]